MADSKKPRRTTTQKDVVKKHTESIKEELKAIEKREADKKKK